MMTYKHDGYARYYKPLTVLMGMLSAVCITASLGLVMAEPAEAKAKCAAGDSSGSSDRYNRKDFVSVNCNKNAKRSREKPQNDQADSENSGVLVGEESWRTPGNPLYDHVKDMFNYMTQEKGLSGAAAAGIIGSIKNESGFVDDRVETGSSSGQYGQWAYNGSDAVEPAQCKGYQKSRAMMCFGMNNKKPVRGMAQYRRNTTFWGGGGLFQETPYTKFTDSKYWAKDGREGWDYRNQIDLNIDEYVFTRQFEKACISYGGKKVQGTFTAESFLQSTDAGVAEEIWYKCVEKGALANNDRIEIARQANSVFNTANVPADPSKWKFTTPGASGSAADLSSSAESGDKVKKRQSAHCREDCKPGDAKNVSTGGEVPMHTANAWHTYDEMPDEFKKDAIDFRKHGMKQRDCKAGNWQKYIVDMGLAGECVSFSKTAAPKLWSRNGQELKIANGNGGQTAYAFAAANGGSVSKDFGPGAIVSLYWPGRESDYGHTLIALQKYSDGSVLVAEQNNEMAGRHAGTVCDWRYKLYDPGTAARFNYFDPSKIGFTLSRDGTGSAAVAAEGGYSDASGDMALAGDKCTKKANASGGDHGAVVDFALQQLGKTYILGANGPDAFDCSGLAWNAYKAAGIDLLGICGRTADQQYHCVKDKGTWHTDLKDCETGALAFFLDGPDHAGHVAIWKQHGDTKIVHAAGETRGIREDGPPYTLKAVGCGVPPKTKTK